MNASEKKSSGPPTAGHGGSGHSGSGQSGDGHSDSGGAGNGVRQPSSLFAQIDRVAEEIYARLQTDDCEEITADPQSYLTAVAESMVNAAGLDHDVVHAAMGELSEGEREVLLLHSGGADCAQIARKQGRTPQVVLRELTRAYSRLRFELEALDGIERTPAGSPPM